MLFHCSDIIRLASQSSCISLRSYKTIMAIPGFFLSLLYMLLLITTQSTANSKKKASNAHSSGVSNADSKCYNVTIEALLHEVKKELGEIREEIKGLKWNKSIREVLKNCAELYKAGKRLNGVYTIDPDGGGAFDVFCDQTTSGGGWAVFQKRLDGSENFYRGWDDYKRGFGNLNGEFWLGLDNIHRLTKERSRLRVDLEDKTGNKAYADYNFFGVASEESKYSLTIGTYSGSAGDSLHYHGGAAFSTKDRDNDNSPDNCAALYKGAWWYNGCLKSNLNGVYHHGKHSNAYEGVNWVHWKGPKYSAKRAEMKIKPIN